MYVQHLDTNGALVSGWSAGGLAITTDAGAASSPRCAPDGLGGVILNWFKNGNAYASRVNSAGTFPTGWATPILIHDHATRTVQASGLGVEVRIASDLAGGAYFLIYSQDGSGRGLYVARLLADGSKPTAFNSATGIEVVNQAGAGGTLTPGGIVLDGTPGATVGAFYCYRDTASSIRARRIASDGTFPWTAALLSGSSTAAAFESSCSDGAGGLIVAWYDTRGGVNGRYAQRIDGTGAVLWTAGGVAVRTTAADGVNGAKTFLVPDGANGAFIAWTRDRSTSNERAMLQRMSAAGARLFGDSAFELPAVRSDQNLGLASDGAGGIVVVWAQVLTPFDIYAQRIDASGNVQWAAGGVGICTATGTQTLPRAAPILIA
jgi:hypothetical protein